MTPARDPSNDDDAIIENDFVALSSYLVARQVEADMAALYLARIRAEMPGAPVDELISLFVRLQATSGDLEADVRTQIVESPELGPLVGQIMLLWYTSASEQAGEWKFGTPEQYFRADVWTVIGAHPPGLSGGYFGYWRYPPEN